MGILLYIGLFIVIFICILSISPKRIKKIQKIIYDLESLSRNAPNNQKYALNELLIFFRLIYTIPGFFWWGFTKRAKLDGLHLLELADLPLPIWEAELYRDLSHVERKPFPGLSKPLRNKIVEYLSENTGLPLLDLGCGSMEVERQSLSRILQDHSDYKPVILGIDLSADAYLSIKDNFVDFTPEIMIKQIDSLENIESMQYEQPTILFYQGDALDVANTHGHNFGMIFSSRFRHHLNEEAMRKLDSISHKYSHYVVEYDDYRTATSWIPPLMTAWYRPVLLSAAIFSQLRQPTKIELIKQKKQMVPHLEIKLFNPPGSYTRTYSLYDSDRLEHVSI